MTIFAIPKAFEGHIGVIQRNAIKSWTLLRPRPEIILFANEEGTTEICSELGLNHAPNIARNEYGTPLLDDLLGQAQRLANNPVLCYVNADIILLNNFMQVPSQLLPSDKRLIIARRWEADIREPLNFDDPKWEHELREFVIQCGRPPFHGVDVFIFSKNFYREIPSFTVGRGYWDDWLIWEAYRKKSMILDVSKFLMIIHQNHPGYSGQGDSQIAEEVKRNYQYNGRWRFIFHRSVPTHELDEKGIMHRVSLFEYYQHIGYRMVSHLIGSTSALRRRLGLYRWWKKKK